MHESKPQSIVNVTIGDGVVVIKRQGKSKVLIANILGVRHDANNQPMIIWLDRMVHQIGEHSFSGWKVSGAISSILERVAAPALGA